MAQLPYQGVVILGFPRSGTTLLRRLLESHPQLCCPPETHILRACAAFLHEDDSPMGYSLGVTTSLRFVGIEPQQVLERVRGLALQLLADVCAISGKPVWVEKSAFDFFHAESITRLLGERCRYIWITRHAADVVTSVKEYAAEVDIYFPELHEYVRRYAAPVEAFAHAWADTNERMSAVAKGLGDSCLRLKYEDFVAEPAAGLDNILEFLELSGAAGELISGLDKVGSVGFGDWKTYGRTSIGAESVGRRSALRPQLLSRVGEIVNPTLELLGYPPVAVPAHTLRGDPVRQLRMGHALRHQAALRQQSGKLA